MSDVDPRKSKYQDTPWEPTISDDSSKDEKKAADDYTDVYGGTPSTDDGGQQDDGTDSVSIAFPESPDLSMAYRTAPDLVGSQSTGGKSNAPVALDSSIDIDLGGLCAAEQCCLNTTSQAIDDYDTLRGVVTSACHSDTIFGQQVGEYVPFNPLAAAGRGFDAGGHVEYSEFRQESVDFANQMVPQLWKLLQAAGNVIEAMGVYNAMLNNAGQMYTTADKNSAFKDPSTWV